MPSTSTSKPIRTAQTTPWLQATCPNPAKRHARTRLVVKSALVALLAAGCLGYALLFAFHLQPVVMLTGSMGSTVPPGSLVVDREVAPATLTVGDIITFQKPLGRPGLDTHRIIAITDSNGHTSYQTKGDANRIPDPWTLQFKGQPAHEVIYTIPHLGWLLLILRTSIARDLILTAVLLTLFSTILKALAAAGTARNAPELRES